MTTLNTIHVYYTALYHTYQLLYCKGHIQITSNHSNVNVETKNNRVNKMITLNTIHLKLYYIISDLPTIIL